MQGLADFANSTADATPDLLAGPRQLRGQQPQPGRGEAGARHLPRATTTLRGQRRVDRGAEREAPRRAGAGLGRAAQPLRALLAGVPVPAQGPGGYEPIVEDTFGGLQPGLHITVEAIKDHGGYVPRPGAEVPRHPRAPTATACPTPRCPAPDGAFNDGYRDEPPSGVPAAAARRSDPARHIRHGASRAAAVAAPVLGVPVDQVPDLVDMLFGPLAAGHRWACHEDLGALFKLIIFMVVTSFLTFMLAATIGNFGFGQDDATTPVQRRHRAAARQRGPHRRRRGRQGQGDRARRASSPTSSSSLEGGRSSPQTTILQLRYRNLVGERYVAHRAGRRQRPTPLPDGARSRSRRPATRST